MAENSSKPSFSIITVTFNSAQTLAQTMESVLTQKVMPKEYLIIDGVSQDDTLAIARGYHDAFKDKGTELIIVSELDRGIYDAMNKGIRIASGDIIGIINSDDWYEKNALETVAKHFAENPFDLFYADLRMHFGDGRTFVKHSKNRKYATSRDWNHPTTFITKDAYDRFGTYKIDNMHDDYDLILRLKKGNARTTVSNETIANFRMNGMSHKRSIVRAIKSVGLKYRIYRQNGYSPLYLFECIAQEAGKLIIG